VSLHEYRSSGPFPTRPLGHRCCPIVRVRSDLGLVSISVGLRQAGARQGWSGAGIEMGVRRR
jgi:hypothetical protein